MVSEIPIFKLQVWHVPQVRAIKDDVIWEERSLERALALVEVLGHFFLPLLWEDIRGKLGWRVRSLGFYFHGLIHVLQL